MTVVSKFALFRLPHKEILQTIRVMELEDILKISLISKRCKDLVTSTKIEGTSINISIENDINISIQTVSSRISLFYYTEPNMYWGMGSYGRKKRLTPPQSVSIDDEQLTRQPFKWKKMDFTMKAWLEHLQNVFNYYKIDIISFRENSSQFDIDDIKEVFGNTTGIFIKNTGCFAFNQMILQQFFPIEDLTITAENFRDSKIPPSLFMQNRVTLSTVESDLDVTIILNDLLLINSKVVTVENPRMPQKLLNNFIKLWQRGSNPCMEYLYIDYFGGEENDEQIVMKGIKYEVNSVDRERYFKSVGSNYSEPVYGGMDVYRMDGVKATIVFNRYETFSIWEMYVWFDHCVA